MLKYSVVALALVAGSSFAVAQQMDRNSSPSASERAPGQLKGSGASARDEAPGQTKNQGSAKEYAPGQDKADRSGGMDKRSDNEKSLSGTSKNRQSVNGDAKQSDGDRNAANTGDRSGVAKKDNDADRSAKSDENRPDRNATNEKSQSRERGSTGASEGTEGRVSGKGGITGVTEEQRTKVKSVFTEHRVEPARGLNVSVNVGVAIPRSIHVYPVPEEVVTIVPAYRGYDYILLEDGRVAIIDPSSFEVVDIIVVT